MMNGGFHGYWRSGRTEDRVKVSRGLVLRILRYFRPYWRQSAVVLLIVGLIAAIGLIPALLLRAVIDLAIPRADASLLSLLVVGMVAAPATAGLLGVLQNYLNTQISQRVMFDLRNELYAHVQSLSLRFFTSVKTGEIMSRLNNDVSGVSRVVGETVTQTVMQVFQLVTTLIVMFGLEWRLTLLAVVLVPLLFAPTRRVGARRYALQHEAQRRQADLTTLMQETLNISGYVLMKAFGRERFERNRFTEKNRALMDVQIRTSMLGRWFRYLLQLFEALGPAVVLLVGGHLILQGEMTLGTIIAFVTLLGRLYGPMSALANVHVEIMGSLALFHRIFEYLDTAAEVIDAPQAVTLSQPARGEVRFRNVGFEYLAGRRALSDLDFTVAPGQLVALVGRSGAGKTTVTYLIPRFYDVTAGSVEIDGHDIRDLTLSSLRGAIGVVTQETYLFNASVRENLRYARDDASDAELDAACRAARLDEVIAQMPNGYDTEVGERGYRLSGGEKQRLAIARVLLKDPRILILDEATSALDSHTEAQIQAALGPLMEGRTTLAIAHRLSTVLAADKLLVLDEGRLVEAGTHAELLARGGLYAELYEIQFKPQLNQQGRTPVTAADDRLAAPVDLSVWGALVERGTPGVVRGG